MDRRQQLIDSKKQNTAYNNEEQLDDEALNDSLIFNIIKKIQFRQKMQNQYAVERESSNKTFITKYIINSWNPAYYLLTVTAIKFYKAFNSINKNSKIFSIGNTLLHLCVAISINQYDGYRLTFKINNQMGDQYKQHKANVDRLIQIKTKKMSMYKKFVNSQFFEPDRVFSALKYRLIL